MGLAFITLLRAFANGGSSLTGLEAISNGVGSFRRPEAKHARQTLVVMSSVLAFLVLGVTMLARWTHAVPYAVGSPTVVSQEVQAIFGRGVIYFMVQIATVLILYTGGNTSFNGFPFLANFVAGDRFLPRQLTRRGHRLAFSNGILVLTAVALALILVFKAQVDGLVSLYAIGVFTGFTMAGSGMVKHHLTHKGDHWRRSVVVNGVSALISGVVVLIFAIAKFKEGAWVVVVVGPLLYLGLHPPAPQYDREERAARDRRRRGVGGAHPAPPRGGGPGGPARHGHGPGHPVRPHADPRRPAGRALRHRLGRGPRARRGVGPPRPGPPAPRHHRVPRPPAGPGGHRAGGRRHPRRRHRVHGAPAPPRATPGSGSASCTTARPTRSPPCCPRCPTSAPPSSRTTCPAASASGCAPTASLGAAGAPAQHQRRRRDRGHRRPAIRRRWTPTGRSGLDRGAGRRDACQATVGGVRGR